MALGNQAAIEALGVSKDFFVAQSGRGVTGAVRQLLSRERRVIHAVVDVSFAIATGSFVGYIGPNGAGKSTTIKMLAGILHPTAGEVRVLGASPQRQREAVAQRIGVVFGQRTQLWWDLPLADSYELITAMYSVPPADARRRLRRFEQALGLDEFMDQQVRKLSLGQRMRADLAGAMLHNPDVLFLDEPTIGLDVLAKAAIREFLKEVAAAGTTILLTTHDMDDVEQLCGRIMLINHGKLMFDGTANDLRQMVGMPTRLHIDFAAPVTLELPAINSGVEYTRDGNRITVAFDRSQVSAAKIIAAFQDRGEIVDLEISEPNIEEIVRRVYLI